MFIKNIVVDILLVTYCQEKFIQQALNGIFIQRVNSDIRVNVIIADDCSTDNTLEIIMANEDRSPFQFQYLANEKNLGIAENYRRAIAASTGDFIAILEGDDYWTDCNRLQKHIDYFVGHLDCVMTKNDYLEYSQRCGEYDNTHGGKQYMFLREMINHYRWANLSATMFRGDVLRNLDEKVYVYGDNQRHEATDWYMTIAVLKKGYGYTIDEVMSVYRVDTGGNISSRDNRPYKDILDMGYLCYEQSLDMLGDNYKNECYQIYKSSIEHVMSDRKNTCYQKMSDYLPPCIAKLLCYGMPVVSNFIRHAVRQCVPNKLYRVLKK